MRKEFYGILPLALTSCLASHATAQEKQSNRPNVVFIYADDIGYGDLRGKDYPYSQCRASCQDGSAFYECTQCGCYQYAFPLRDADR